MQQSMDTASQIGSIVAGDEKNTWAISDINICWDVEDEHRAKQPSGHARYMLLTITNTPSSPAGLILREIPSRTDEVTADLENTRLSPPQLIKFIRVATDPEFDGSGPEPESDSEKQTITRWRDYDAHPEFWDKWKVDSTLQRFVLV
jgi:hypothetical protein